MFRTFTNAISNLGTHLSATVYAVAEKAADIIKARHKI